MCCSSVSSSKILVLNIKLKSTSSNPHLVRSYQVPTFCQPVPQAAQAKLNGKAPDAAAARLQEVEAKAAAAEEALRAERDALAAQAAGLQSSISDLQGQLAAAKVSPQTHTNTVQSLW